MNAYNPIHRALSLAIAVAAAAGIAACGGQPGEKSGAAAERQVTLTLEMPDAGDKLGTAFAESVEQRSDGSVRIELGRGYDNSVPANELRLAHALEAGGADAGYLPARAWSAAGIPAFQALLAPFAVTTDEAAQALASGQIARDVLATLPDSVVGLSLVPAESRRVLADRPPLSPTEFRGLRLRVIDVPQSAAALEALGATAVQGLRAREATSALQRGDLDGVESAPTHILTNGYWNHARHLSSYGVFPKFQSIVVSRQAWERLSAAQQTAVRDAANETTRAARAVVAAQERSDLSQLCAAGTAIAVPSHDQLRALAEATRAAAAKLADDETASRVLDAMRELPGAGPQPLASPLPTDCTDGVSGDPSTPQSETGAFPEGVFAAKVSPAEFREAGAINPKFDHDWTYTTRFRDGRFTQTVKPSVPDECPCNGSYQVDGDQLTLTWSQPALPPETLKWSYFDGVLRFEPIDVTDPAERALVGQPWRKIG